MQAQAPYNGWAADVWEIGSTLFTVVFGINPYAVASPALCPQYAAIARGQLVDMIKHWGLYNRVSPACVDLINALMTPDPARRPTAEQALAHPWFAPLSQ